MNAKTVFQKREQYPTRWGLLMAIALFAAICLASCAPVESQTPTSPAEPASAGSADMPNPASVYCTEQGYRLEIRTAEDGSQAGYCIFPDNSECDEWAFFRGECQAPAPSDLIDALQARDAALKVLKEQNPAIDLPENPTWEMQDLTPEGLVGASKLLFTAGDWQVEVSYPIVNPAEVIYSVSVKNTLTGFEFSASVDARGNVTPSENSQSATATSALMPVIAWVGHIASAPSGAQYDDYLTLMPEGTGEVGLDGSTQELQAQIEALRDGEGVEKYVHVWGSLACGVPDVGGCQIIVTQLRYGQFLEEPYPIEGWTGTVECSHFNEGPTPVCGTAFALAGDFPVWYGLWSQDSMIQQQLEAARETATPVKIWGQLLVGVPDVNGSQIQVSQIEMLD